ncbi:phosphatidylinositol 5-phosphate 4-kinase type-2 beta [Platysternon megacephalum]|uniref:deoxyribonuclease II n=1 Tax=Platysternon megacephalum TaxID=55544 RepID=A0A4D9EII6_9SAUR|nr:phosphatidylinositol 5-phosphate 4-kinase type-2 beta [Platysternon megacephalum]
MWNQPCNYTQMSPKLRRYRSKKECTLLNQTRINFFLLNDSTAYVIYNDDVPHSKHYSWKQGHTKGFLLLDKSQGFWGIHSIPLFPPFPEEGYGYPPTGKQNAQMAICITFRYNQFAEIDKQLLCYNPNIYSCSIPGIFHPDLPNLQKLCVGSALPLVPWRHLSKLQSAQGENFLHFAKSRFFVDDIYVAWMAQQLQTDLLAESWQHDGQELPSNCSLQHHVYNINLIKTPWNSTFSSYYDHSKWCVSWRYEDQWTCIGDLNRAPQQAWRSGLVTHLRCAGETCIFLLSPAHLPIHMVITLIWKVNGICKEREMVLAVLFQNLHSEVEGRERALHAQKRFCLCRGGGE